MKRLKFYKQIYRFSTELTSQAPQLTGQKDTYCLQ